jgi:hypothetical protein
VVALREGLGHNAELLQEFPGFLLDHDLVQHHASAPHASPDAELTLEKGHPMSPGREEIAGHETGGSSTHDADVYVQTLLKLSVPPFENGSRDHALVECHDFLVPIAIGSNLLVW